MLGGRRAQRQAANAPARVAEGQKLVEPGRLVGAMEGADADVHDAGHDLGPVKGGPADPSWQAAEQGLAQALMAQRRSPCPVLWPRSDAARYIALKASGFEGEEHR